MNPLQFLFVLRAHYKVALAVFLLTIATGLAITLMLPKRYVASASLVFDVKSVDPVAGVTLPINLGYMATQVDILKSDRVGRRVVNFLRLDQNPEVRKQWKEATGGKTKLDLWLADLLSNGLQATPSRTSNIITIDFYATDPSFAAAVANAYAQVYIDANIELKVDPARQYAQWFGEQAKGMRDNLEKAQAKLSEFQQEKGIVAKDEQADAETAKLIQLTSQLTAAQGQTVEVLSKQRSGSSDSIPEIAQSSLVQNLKSDIARQEAKLREAGENLGQNHPQYQRMEAEIASLKNQLAGEKLYITSGLATSKNIAMDKESQLNAAIAIQKKKLLELNSERDKLAVLQRDVDAAKSAYDTVTKRYNQTSLESQVTQTNVSVLNTAVEPAEPASPNFHKNMLVTFMLGILLGAGSAYLLELLDRRIRSVQDLEDMLQVPVLADLSSTRKQKRLALLTQKTLRLEFK